MATSALPPAEVLVELRALGIPAPQGSKMAYVIKGTQRAGMKESSRRLPAWRDAVSACAAAYVEAHGATLAFPLDGPLGLDVEFRFPMPASYPKWLRAHGRVPKLTAPDTSKLVRSTEDALQAAGLLADDARICRIAATKAEVVGWTGCHLRITREVYPTRGTPLPLEQLELVEGAL